MAAILHLGNVEFAAPTAAHAGGNGRDDDDDDDGGGGGGGGAGAGAGGGGEEGCVVVDDGEECLGVPDKYVREVMQVAQCDPDHSERLATI